MQFQAAWDRVVASTALTLVFGREYKRRIRLLQWCMAGTIYLGSGLVMWTGVSEGWTHPGLFAGWTVFVTLGLVSALVAIRAGWTDRLRDPGLTGWQIVMGCLAVDWGYLMCGPLRTIALFPVTVILAFGAFTLDWRRIMGLAAFALVSLALTMQVLALRPQLQGTWPATAPSIDRVNMLMMLVMMPALAVIAARLSSMRMRLRAQRTHLSGELDSARRMATVDELTGLPNRRALLECMARFQADAARTQRAFAVALIDLDHFKKVNDSLGHASGDVLLQEFGRVALESTRGHDIVGRWGGEEFLILLHGVDDAMGMVVVERLQRRARDLRRFDRPVTFSGGIALHRPGEDVLDTVARADEAMYEAKRAGRNRVLNAERGTPV